MMTDFSQDFIRLGEVVEACEGRIDPGLMDAARVTLDRVGQRLSLSRDVTVIAIAGATGAGKSSIFNALTRTALAESGVRRPMTTKAMAITFGNHDTTDLLDWLQIARRHVAVGEDLSGIVLVDLADNDSIAADHREEVDRLVEVVDQFLWVVDPQKYADAVLHEGYLQRFADYGAVMTFVLNQVDKLSPTEMSDLEKDLERLLVEDGIAKPTIFSVSAMTGAGIDVLRKHLVTIASEKQAHSERLHADLIGQAKAINTQIGEEEAGSLGHSQVNVISTACMEVAGAQQISEAVRVSVAQRGASVTGLPWLAWISKFRVDPLARLHLDQFASKKSKDEVKELTRTSMVVHPVARARIDIAMRELSDDAMGRLPDQWGHMMTRIAKEKTAELSDAIDQAVVGTDLGLNQGRSWWNLVRVLQWFLFVVMLGGLGWLALNFVVVSFLGLPEFVTPMIGYLPVPTWMVLGGFVSGLILAGVSKMIIWVGAKAAATRALRNLRRSMEVIANEIVVSPMNDELHRHDEARRALKEILH